MSIPDNRPEHLKRASAVLGRALDRIDSGQYQADPVRRPGEESYLTFAEAVYDAENVCQPRDAAGNPLVICWWFPKPSGGVR